METAPEKTFLANIQEYGSKTSFPLGFLNREAAAFADFLPNASCNSSFNV
ncbi:MAG: hypothetical protein WC322_02530 [Candidatus Paceibacterota bacterium]|jgi:hypothetical protein|nr:hypothetical protein [Candidatus Paceibacterota bacterium]MDD4830647.1 hypothetical protein [Candidatus Paceibacterota bacterium]MDD4875164.1 hypothetical protein [Candidatus Paceibacterota bacterium]